MRDCPDGDLRDLLPDLIHDRLAPAEADRVRAHVARCAACEGEVALLMSLRGAFDVPVPVDMDAIVADVVRRTASRGVPRVADAAGRRGGWLRAATLVLAVGGASYAVARSTGPQAVPAGVTPATDLAFAGHVSDLADDEIRLLEGAITELERQPMAEPDAVDDAPPSGATNRRGA